MTHPNQTVVNQIAREHAKRIADLAKQPNTPVEPAERAAPAPRNPAAPRDTNPKQPRR